MLLQANITEVFPFNGHNLFDDFIKTRTGAWEVGGIPSYGVCDSIAQFHDRFHAEIELISKSADTVLVAFTHVRKDPGVANGWRWRKWGEYVGTGKPTVEYLNDEDGFDDGVWVFELHQLRGGALWGDANPIRNPDPILGALCGADH